LRPSVSLTDRLLNAVTDKSGHYLRISMYAPQEFPKEKITTALCSNGKTVKVRYIPNPSVKVKPYNPQIGQIPGGLYETTKGAAEVGHHCFLIDENFLTDREILTYTSTSPDPLPKDLKTKIEDAKQRKIDKSWHKATITGLGELYFVLFKPEGLKALASLTLIKNNGKFVYQDYPGKLEPADEYPSVWRVDDGGQIDPLDFDIVYYFKTKDGVEMIIFWAGPEGINIALVKEAGNIFYPIYTDYIINAH
jgi:hypothetical protein